MSKYPRAPKPPVNNLRGTINQILLKEDISITYTADKIQDLFVLRNFLRNWKYQIQYWAFRRKQKIFLRKLREYQA